MENVLAKKLSIASVSRSPIPDIERLGNMVIRAVEQKLRPILKASISGMVLDCEVTKLSAVAEGIPVPALLGILDIPGAANSAMINVSADLAYHIVDLRIGGDPGKCPTPTTRSFTAIDYALCTDILTAVSECFESAIEDSLDGPLQAHFYLADIKQNVTEVNIAPNNADVLHLNAALDIGDAARGGDIDLIVPLSVLDVVRASVKQEAKEVFSVNDIWRNRMRRAVDEAPIPMTGILHRAHYKAEFLENLTVGQVLPIPAIAPQNLSLVMNAGGRNEAHFATAKLGGFEGKKVLKLVAPPNPDFVRHLAEVISASS